MTKDWEPGDDIFLLCDDKTADDRDITEVFEALRATANEHGFDSTMARFALGELWWEIGKGWPMSKESYPRLDGPEDHHSLVHIVLHLVKSTGKVAAAVEPYDHGKEIDRKILCEQLSYTLINLLRVASLAKITPGDLMDDVEKWVSEHPGTGCRYRSYPRTEQGVPDATPHPVGCPTRC